MLEWRVLAVEFGRLSREMWRILVLKVVLDASAAVCVTEIYL
jgi:hypothetical protein